MTSLEQRTNAQIESQLQEARRNFDNLKAKIAGFQGTLKGIPSRYHSKDYSWDSMKIPSFKIWNSSKLKLIMCLDIFYG